MKNILAKIKKWYTLRKINKQLKKPKPYIY